MEALHGHGARTGECEHDGLDAVRRFTSLRAGQA